MVGAMLVMRRACDEGRGTVTMVDGADELLVCRDCEQSFVFTAGEQAFYAERGFNKPTRCTSCRAQRRSERNAEVLAVQESGGGGGYASAGGDFGGGYGGRGGGERGFGGPRQLFPAVCAECGKETEVPFQPRGDRPVYCRDCFNRQRGR